MRRGAEIVAQERIDQHLQHRLRAAHLLLVDRDVRRPESRPGVVAVVTEHPRQVGRSIQASPRIAAIGPSRGSDGRYEPERPSYG